MAIPGGLASGLMTPFIGRPGRPTCRYRNFLRQTRSGREPSGLKSSSGMSLNVNCGGVRRFTIPSCPIFPGNTGTMRQHRNMV